MGRKAISQIMGMLLVLIVVISLTGASFWFFNTLRGGLETSTGEASVQERTRVETRVTIESLEDDRVHVRNTGTVPIDGGYTVYINDYKVDSTQPILVPDAAGELILQEPVSQILFKQGYGDAETAEVVVKVVTKKGTQDILVATKQSTAALCGDGTCQVSESCGYCAQDCGQCEVLVTVTPQALSAPGTVRVDATVSGEASSVQTLVTRPDGVTETLDMTKAGGVWTLNYGATDYGAYSMRARAYLVGGGLKYGDGGQVLVTNWLNGWNRRKLILVDEIGNVNRKGEIATIQADGLTINSNCQQEIRVATADGTILPVDVQSGNSTSCTFSAQIDIKSGGIRQLPAILYYDNPAAPAPSYASDLTTSSDCVGNSLVKLCTGTTDGGITHLGVEQIGLDNNLLTSHTPDSKYYRTGIQPAVDYAIGWDMLFCSNYTKQSTTVNRQGPLTATLEHTFGTTCGSKSYDYKYIITVYNNRSLYDLEVRAESIIDFTPGNPSYLPYTNWDSSKITLTTSFDCSTQQCAFWTPVQSPNQLGVGVLRLRFGAVVTSMIPTNAVTVDDRDLINPGMIAKTRTVFSLPSDISVRTREEWTRAGTPVKIELSQEEIR